MLLFTIQLLSVFAAVCIILVQCGCIGKKKKPQGKKNDAKKPGDKNKPARATTPNAATMLTGATMLTRVTTPNAATMPAGTTPNAATMPAGTTTPNAATMLAGTTTPNVAPTVELSDLYKHYKPLEGEGPMVPLIIPEFILAQDFSKAEPESALFLHEKKHSILKEAKRSGNQPRN